MDLLPQLIFPWYWEITCTLLLLFLFLCLAFLGRWHSSLNQTRPRKGSIENKWNLGQPSYKSLSTLLKCWLCLLSFLPKRHHLIFSARRYQCNNCSHYYWIHLLMLCSPELGWHCLPAPGGCGCACTEMVTGSAKGTLDLHLEWGCEHLAQKHWQRHWNRKRAWGEDYWWCLWENNIEIPGWS